MRKKDFRIPEDLIPVIEQRIRDGKFGSMSNYIRYLIHRDLEEQGYTRKGGNQ